jgi:hypothetical protein
LRLDLAPTPDETAAPSAKESLLQQSVRMSANSVRARNTALFFRGRIDWPTLRFGLWFIVIMLAAAGLVRSLQDNRLRLTPLAGDVEDSTATSRAHSTQGDGIVDPESRLGSQIDTIGRFEPTSPETGEAVSGDFTRRSEDGEGLAGARSVPAPDGGQVKISSDDDVRGEGGEKSRSRVVVRLDQDKTVRVSGRVNQRPTLGVFNVVGTSLVRDKPTADADMMGSLEPGTRVRVTGKAGDYLRVQGLDGPMISGYVHVEDAFFEPVR